MSEIQISKTLLILKSTTNSTASAEQFLRNREWLVFSTTNLKDFLTYIIQKKPSFVMITVDHPNKKVLMMPKVLIQSFPVCVFTFAESPSSVSYRRLQDSHCAYKINPPATGPAIERTVNKYLRDQEKKIRDQNEKPAVDANGKPLETVDSNSKTTMIQTGGGPATGNETIDGGGWNQAASIFSQLFDGDDAVKLDKDSSDGATQISGNVRGSGPAYSGSDSVAGGIAGGGSETGNEQPAREKNKNGGQSGSISYSESDFEGNDGAHPLGKTSNSIFIGKNKNDKKETATTGEVEDAREAGKLKSPKKYEKEGKIITIKGRNTSDGPESIILKGTKQALDETVHVHDGVVINDVSDSSQVACIVVESEKFNGYLIAALGKNRKMDGQFIKSIQEKLFKFLKDNGETVTEKENLNLKIKKIEFEDWAIEYAEFLKKSVHNGDEIAMAFFPLANVRTEVGESASTTMVSVKLAEMEGDKHVEFNVYLYLPSNKKYILYTPKGGKFYANQKRRLEEKGIKEVHVLKSEVNELSKDKAQKYLNNLIDSYKHKKTAKAA
ncbi:MAG: hypothetical protein B7Y39_02250 [Bdellovibrio sp. 28-41-41]|nr:MAG: hypothetical protein B7Y39_02250 [Bdellovibrio sp. 28-41-41]